MEREVNIEKVVRQHAEMEQFLAGFGVRDPRAGTPDSGPVTPHPSHEPKLAGREPRGTSHEERATRNEHPATSTQPRPTTRKRRATSDEAVARKAAELEKIAEEVRRCCKCGLGSSRTNAVPGEGNPDARIMFVGEAPGADEDAQGRPFVGRAGHLLDKIIEACGLKRKDVFIGNVLKCRPPDNRDPRAEEIISCLPYLQKQIEIIEPEVIVALGAHAARTLLDTTKSIGELRGHFHEYYAGIGRPPIKLMATYHTAYLLRSYTPENRRRVWEDMKKVLAELGLPVPEQKS
jgi:uracil-DNA glycosylase family 4